MSWTFTDDPGVFLDAAGTWPAARPLASANADRATALAVAAHWPGHRVDEERRPYRLDGLVPPCPAPPGAARSARPGDRALLVRRHQGRGYAAAVTAQVARTALDGGAEHVLLFADPANPTSNGVYRRIGFRAGADRLAVGAEPDHG
ncbi:GNAT family N-acetyltransferase [Streptomyces sp. NPDC058368]|uniref:GNAT family N-acetyltransferase n=1 Tax=Streptomyces sp. NPDC058368 TaxID=3346461 RepID=UPI00365BFFDB